MNILTVSPQAALLDQLRSISHIGWRVDGWPALLGFDAEWHSHRGGLVLDGPTSSAATSLEQLLRLLGGAVDDEWTASVVGRLSGEGRSLAFTHPDGQAVMASVRWHRDGPLPTMLHSRLGITVPLLHELVGRRLHVLVSTPVTTPAWERAAIETAALLHTSSVWLERHRDLSALPDWIVASARHRLAGEVDRAWPGPQAADIRSALAVFVAGGE